MANTPIPNGVPNGVPNGGHPSSGHPSGGHPSGPPSAGTSPPATGTLTANGVQGQVTGIMQWGVQQVGSWLRANSLEKHERTFVEHDISGEVLLELNHEILREMKVATVGDRVRILVAVKALRRKTLSGRDETTRVSSLPAAAPGSPRARNLYTNHSTTSAVLKRHPMAPSPIYKPNGSSSSSSASRHQRKLAGSSPPMSPISPSTIRQRSNENIPPHVDDDPYASVRVLDGYRASARSPVGPLAPRNLPPIPYSRMQRTTPQPGGPNPPARRQRKPSEEGIAGFYGSLSRTSSNNPQMSAEAMGGLQINPRTPGQGSSSRGHLPSPKSPRQMDENFHHDLPTEPQLVTLDSVSKACIRVVGDDGQSRVVTLSEAQARDPTTIIVRVLEKFNLKGNDPRDYGLFLSGGSGESSGARPITDKELLTIVRSPARPERDKLILRRRHNPPSSESLARHREEKAKKAKLENFFGEKIPPTTTARTHHKLQNFFGARPPSELISSNLQDFFPVSKLRQCEEERKRRSRTSSDAGSLHRLNDSMNAGMPPAYGAAVAHAVLASNLVGQGSGRNSRSHSIMSTHSSTFGKELKGEGEHEMPDRAGSQSSDDGLMEDLRKQSAMQQQQQAQVPPSLPSPAPPLSADIPPPAYPENQKPPENAAFPPPIPQGTAEAKSQLEARDSTRSRTLPKLPNDPTASLRRSDSMGEGTSTAGAAAPVFDSPQVNPTAAAVPEPLNDKEGTSAALAALNEGHPHPPPGDAPEDQISPSEAPIRWIRGAIIGKGSFGSVYLGMNALSGELMAVKRVELPKSEAMKEKTKFQLDALEREIAFLRDLDHENIVRYLGSLNDQDFLNIFLEYVPGGSVTALLENYGAFEEPLVKNFVRQVLLGLNYLHERDIIHRDIKGGNILVDNKGVAKISDFGISKVEDVSDMATLQPGHRASLQGSVYWMAPEVVKHMRYTRKADIWSFGCLVIEMLTAAHPWPSIGQVEALFKIGSYAIPEVPETISDDAKDFLLQSFRLDFQERPSADALLKHNFTTSGTM